MYVYIFLIFILVIAAIIERYLFSQKMDKFFYNIRDISRDLDNIDSEKVSIYNECMDIYMNSNWVNWPEKDLYAAKNKTSTWKIFPFYAFGIWVNDNCDKCPKLYKFLKSIKGLKLATLSKLSPHMKLTPHQGWANHSNSVIRCHYGILIPDGCYISVSNSDNPPMYNKSKSYKMNMFPSNIYNYDDNGFANEEIRFHRQFKWLIFDDSKTHYAENMSNKDRIVLIIDIERPKNIKTGSSQIGDTSELKELINYYKNWAKHGQKN